ncbi:MAG: glycosyltransferase [Proteobacteria bacterium]|nr:glycosyltransferase [Pseudomonadota bacterium]MBU1456574.1 glycosyltransferase [Pseudomonadota bacterium]
MTIPRVLLVCHASSTMGLGHLARLLALAQAIRKTGTVHPEFLIIGDAIKNDELSSFSFSCHSPADELEQSVKIAVTARLPRVVVFDLYSKLLSPALEELFAWLQSRKIRSVGVDSLVNYCQFLDFVWVPSFNFDSSKIPSCTNKLKYGWDSFLIQKRLPGRPWKSGPRILVLTGGADVTHLGNTLPQQLDMLLTPESEIHWVRGPYAVPPIVPDNQRLLWHIHDAPPQLDELIVQSNYVLTVFGVSFFEVLQYGIPAVVFSPYGAKDQPELEALKEERVAVVCHDPDSAVQGLIELMTDTDLATAYSQRALEKLSTNGAQKLAKLVCSLAGV